MPIHNFGTTNLNPADMFCRWCKLNFQLLQDQLKSCHFSKVIEAKRKYFYFLYVFLGIIGFRQHPPGIRSRSDVSFRSHIGRDVADHAETSSQRRDWYVNQTDLFEMSL